MEFLVEFDLDIPAGASESEVYGRKRAEASAAATLVDDGTWYGFGSRPPQPPRTRRLVSTAPTAKRSSMGSWTHSRSATGCASP